MRARVGWSIALLLAMTLPMTVAQTPTEVELLSESTGDVQIQTSEGPVDAPQEQYQFVDLVSLKGIEEKDTVVFTLALASLERPTPAQEGRATYNVDFMHNGVQYRASVDVNVFSDGASSQTDTRGWLSEYDPGYDRYGFLTEIEHVVDPAGGTITMTVVRQDLIDNNGAAPFPGRALESFWASAVTKLLSGSTIVVNGKEVSANINVEDRMPNGEEAGTTSLPIVLGLTQDGHARLRSEEPFRFSNGEASTFVYKVEAINLRDREDTFQIDFQNVPGDWEVRTPTPVVRIPAGGSIDVPVILRTEFGHDHGKTTRFLMEMTSRSDAGSQGRIELGIHYPEIAQPAGHHDELWLHSTDDTRGEVDGAFALFDRTVLGNDRRINAYMNAFDQDAGDMSVDVPAQQCMGPADPDGDPTTITYCWEVPLQPRLKMGLDFITDGVGELTVSVQTQVPMAGAKVHGELKHAWFRPSGSGYEPIETALASFESDVEELAPSAEQPFTVAITPTPESDLIPYEKTAVMWIDLRITGQRVEVPARAGVHDLPLLKPGGTLRLPLLEYEDPISEAFGRGSDVHLMVEEQERFVNPAKTVVHEIKVHNGAGEKRTFSVAFSGTNADWAQLLTGKSVTVAPDGEGILAIAVTPPSDAEDGARSDLVVEASHAESNLHGLVRVVTTVDTGKDHPDDSHRLEQYGVAGKDSPGIVPVALLAALAAAAVLWRRRP